MGLTKRFERILMATDGGEAARAAVDATIAIATSSTAKVRVLHVWNLEVRNGPKPLDIEARSEADKLVDETVGRLLRAGVIAEPEIYRADSKHVAAAIASAAKAFGADLVVIGSRGLSDWQSLAKHSVSHQLLCGLDCPVLIARGRESGTPIKVSKVLLAIAGGDDLGPGVRAAVAAAQDASVMVVHVAQTIVGVQGFTYVESGDEIRDTVAQACKLLREAGVDVQAVVAHERPVAKAVARIASEWDADLIVIGSSRMSDLGSLLLGSVSHDLLHLTDLPVLIAERLPA